MRRLAKLLVMLLTVTVGGLSGGYWYTSTPAERTWPIVIQQTDGNLVLSDEQGQTRPLTTDADGQRLAYLFPTPAPDGRSVAAVAVRHAAASASAALVVVGVDGQRTTLFDQPDRSPFYLSWSPDSAKIAFLTSTTGGMALHAALSNGQEQPRQIAPGQPSYFAWSPNSQRLLLHIGGSAREGGSLQLYEWGAVEPQPLTAQPGRFQTPGWLPDGQRALAVVQQDDGAALATIDAGGAVEQRLTSVTDSTLFVPAPDATHIAYVTLSSEGTGRLHVLRSDGSDKREIDATTVVTCFWSPNSQRLAFLSVVPNDIQTAARAQRVPQLRWSVLTLADGQVRDFAPFEPSVTFLSLLPFFDQYAQSHRVWDRAGSRLLYADDTGVNTLDVTTGQSQRIGPGVLGLWMEQ